MTDAIDVFAKSASIFIHVSCVENEQMMNKVDTEFKFNLVENYFSNEMNPPMSKIRVERSSMF